MTYISFLFYSTLEQFALLFFGFSIFRIRLAIADYVRLATLTISTSIISLMMTYYSFYEGLRPVAIFMVTIACINLVKKIRLKTALILVPLAYIIFITIQTALLLIMYQFELISLDVKPFSASGYLLQFITFLFFIIISIGVKIVLKDGFMFDPEFNPVKKYNKKLRYSNNLILIMTSFALAIIASLYYENVNSKISIIVYVISILSLLFSIGIFYISFKRDQEEAEIIFSSILGKGGEER